MNKNKHTEISALGKSALMERLLAGFPQKYKSTVSGAGDDAAVIDTCPGKDGNYTLLATSLLLEGIDFDLVYFPLKHLGWKAVVAACGRVLAMNGSPRQITVSTGVSAKLSVEDLEEFYAGVRAACEEYGIDLVGIDVTASLTGFTISAAVVGDVAKDMVAYRSGAGQHDLICITGDLGAAYMGLHLLEREKRALEGHPDPKPRFDGYEYLLRRQLQPLARKDVIDAMRDAGIVPTSMTDLTHGLAADLLRVCKSSDCGARIYLERIPIARETTELAAELHIDQVVAALNGGDDHELLFTVPVAEQEKIVKLGGIDIIGHVTTASSGAVLVTPDGSQIPLTSPGVK